MRNLFTVCLAKAIILFDAKYNKNVNDLVVIIKKCKYVVSDSDITECISDIVELNKEMGSSKKYSVSKQILGKLLEYLSDTIYHNEHKFHKPAHNGWSTKRSYPDINDYIKIGNEKI